MLKQNAVRQAGTVWDLQDSLNTLSEPQGWKAFSEASPKPVYGAKKDSYTTQKEGYLESGSARFDVTSNMDVLKKVESSQQSKASGGSKSGEVWGFEDKFASSGSGVMATKVPSQGSQKEVRNDNAIGYNGKGRSHSVVHNTPSGWSNF